MAKAVRYLIQSPNVHDCHFIVGAEKKSIGVVKELVAEASEAFRKMLVESDIRETGPVELPDDHPDAVKIFLKFAYGGLGCEEINAELTDSLSNGETALHVVGFADKYLVDDLKDIALVHLKPTTVDNLFPALHCVAMYNASYLEPLVLEIVKNKTNEVLQHPDFLDICLESLMYLVQQERLNVSEVDLWKAVVDWAEHSVKPEAGDTLRSVLEKPMKHIRLYNLTNEEFWTSVDPHKVFTKEEISDYHEGAQLKQDSTSEVFCSRTDKRNVSEINRMYDAIGCVDLTQPDPVLVECTRSQYKIHVDKSMKLTKLELHPNNTRLNTVLNVKLWQEHERHTTVEATFTSKVIPSGNFIVSLKDTELGKLQLSAGSQYILDFRSEKGLVAHKCIQYTKNYVDCGEFFNIRNHSHVKKIYFTHE